MIKAAFAFVLLAVVLAVLGFGGLVGAAVGIVKILFWVAVGIAILLFILRLHGLPRRHLTGRRLRLTAHVRKLLAALGDTFWLLPGGWWSPASCRRRPRGARPQRRSCRSG